MNETLFYSLLTINVLACITLFIVAIKAINKHYEGQSIKGHITAMITLGIIMYLAAALTAILLTQQAFTVTLN